MSVKNSKKTVIKSFNLFFFKVHHRFMYMYKKQLTKHLRKPKEDMTKKKTVNKAKLLTLIVNRNTPFWESKDKYFMAIGISTKGGGAPVGGMTE